MQIKQKRTIALTLHTTHLNVTPIEKVEFVTVLAVSGILTILSIEKSNLLQFQLF